MPIELKIPEVGESITEVLIAEWRKAEGDAVTKSEAVAVIDSEKTTFELPAPESGTLGKILHQAGETVAVGDIIGYLESSASSDAPAQSKSDDKPAPAVTKEGAEKGKPQSASLRSNASVPSKTAKTQKSEGENRAPAETTETTTVKAKAPATSPARSKGKEPAPTESKPRSPAQKSAAETDSTEVFATVAEEPKVQPPPSLEVAAITRAADGEEEVVPMSMLRRTVARRLVEAKQQMAMLTTFNEVDMSAVQALRNGHREAFEERYQVRLGLMSFFVKAAVDALKQFPQLNAEVRGKDIVYRNYFNIGVALASGRGLVVPVLRRADRMSFAAVEKAIGDFSQRAKDAKLKPEDLEGATFTITNGGVFGSLLSTPIVNPPQAGILGMHAIQDRPVALQGQVVIRPMMYLALTYDHRLVDGREAVLFTRRIKEAIETPARLLLEI